MYTFFSFTQFDTMKPIQLLKTYKKMCKCIEFLHQNYQQQANAVVQSSNNTLNKTIQRLV